MIYQQTPQKSETIKTASKTKTNMKNYLRGFFFCVMWYLSIIAGFFLLICPMLPLVIISPKRYRKWSDRIFGLWEPFPVAMMEVCFGIRVVLSGDKINPFEGSLFVMNHRTRVDWNFLWLGLFHCCQPNAHNIKYILKAPLMHFPGAGWVMQTCSFIFIHRNWAKDRPLLNNIIEYLTESDSLYQILIFPEGTDLTENNIQKSHKYAEEHNLQKYSRVLHPRTTGFTFIANKMMSSGHLKAIYDVTVAYPKTMPQTEADLFRGKFPEEVHFNVKRYSYINLPHTEEELKTWLNTVWKEKEEKLHRFYATGCFTGEGDGPVYNLSNEDVDFGRMSIKNGVIKYDVDGNPNPSTKEISVISVQRGASSRQATEVPSIILEEMSNSVLDQVKSEESVKEESNIQEENQGSYVSVGNVKSEPVEKDVSSPQVDNEGSKPTIKEESAGSVRKSSASESPVKPSTSKNERRSATGTDSEIFARNHVNCEDVYRSKNYRPSHLLYMVLVFWLTLIILTIHQLCYNFYLQIWVLTHSLFFTALSFLSNGFHHVAASIYFYRHERKSCVDKKYE